jgi:glycosyltransferase involved in cell wall biosynthesis
MNDELLLSICIPTYNRADILSRTLEELFVNPDFDAAKIEVVVSDNASTDHTAEVVARYPSVRYYRNETNLGSNPNFTVLLNRARGKYLRLMNDTVRFNEGMLGKMLREIEAADQTRENLYFASSLPRTKHKEYVVHGKNQFIGIISFYITWIANFGMWRTDFEKIEDKDRFVDTLLHQVDWTLCMAGNGKEAKIYNDKFLQVEEVSNKGTYDFFNVFIVNYFSILKFHRINRFRMAIEKYRLFRYFILDFLNRNNQYMIDTQNKAILVRRYWYEPYYLPFTFLFKIRKQILKK